MLEVKGHETTARSIANTYRSHMTTNIREGNWTLGLRNTTFRISLLEGTR